MTSKLASRKTESIATPLSFSGSIFSFFYLCPIIVKARRTTDCALARNRLLILLYMIRFIIDEVSII